jgi:hypothetical protein
MNAFCERNRQAYLSLPGSAARWNSVDCNAAPPSASRMLCPLLFTVSKQVPECQLSAWLTLLLKLGNAVGSNDSRKRSFG